jgi:hypothetical protein
MKENYLKLYFDLNIPNEKLYKKSNALKGCHGVEELNGEYFATHYHLKKSIAKNELKAQLQEIQDKDLKNLAKASDDSFHNWPVVQLEDGTILQKYKYTWILKHFIYEQQVNTKLRDFCLVEIGEKAVSKFDILTKPASETEKYEKFVNCRSLIELVAKDLVRKKYMPTEFETSNEIQIIPAMSYFLQGRKYRSRGVELPYKLRQENQFPTFIISLLDPIRLLGNSDVHSSSEFDEYILFESNSYARNTAVYSTLAFLDYVQLYYSKDLLKENWVS